MNNMNKNSDNTKDSEAKKSLQTDPDASEESQDNFDGSDKDNDTSQYKKSETSPSEEADTSSDSSQDSQTLELDGEEGDKDTSQSEDSDSSSSSDSSQDSPPLEIPKALLEVDPNDQDSVVKAIGLLVTMINSQLSAIKSKVLPKSPLDYMEYRQKKLWRMRKRDKAQYKDSSE
ncbi:clumping factor B [Drosophila yakuba]|uniref:Uncharacterized protein, isoform B n=1 Tax=Drosophila yakuba TaxID=7245 RepID=B4PHN8_DROYA|nr:clumping factor B [Drosophila yakuba]EDW93347.2 uncharacterized protein Dyak_GE21408, isoform B [Drosophila yakuba]